MQKKKKKKKKAHLFRGTTIRRFFYYWIITLSSWSSSSLLSPLSIVVTWWHWITITWVIDCCVFFFGSIKKQSFPINISSQIHKAKKITYVSNFNTLKHRFSKQLAEFQCMKHTAAKNLFNFSIPLFGCQENEKIYNITLNIRFSIIRQPR